MSHGVRKLVGGSSDRSPPPSYCVTLLVLWPMRWEMDCLPLVKGQYCSGGSRSAPHSSLHYSFCCCKKKEEAEKNWTFWLSSKWKLCASNFLQVLSTCLRKVQESKPSQEVGVWRQVYLPPGSKQRPWMISREEWPAYSKEKRKKERKKWSWVCSATYFDVLEKLKAICLLQSYYN